MLKWKIFTAVGFAFGIAGITWGYAQEQTFPGVYELRIYQAEPGKRDALAARFATRTAAIYERNGITNVGFWIPQQSDKELGIDVDNTFIYMLGFPSMAEREKRLKGRASDPEFRQVVIEGERNPATKLIRKAHTVLIVPSGRYSAIKVTP
jgi:NIPSNAP